MPRHALLSGPAISQDTFGQIESRLLQMRYAQARLLPGAASKLSKTPFAYFLMPALLNLSGRFVCASSAIRVDLSEIHSRSRMPGMYFAILHLL